MVEKKLRKVTNFIISKSAIKNCLRYWRVCPQSKYWGNGGTVNGVLCAWPKCRLLQTCQQWARMLE
eukprot:7300987-Ditylum_brightwellii.AAC.1